MIDEHTRHQLYLRLEQALGPEEATTLMEHLPPIGWADVATKHDLTHLEHRIDLRLAGLEDRIDLRFEQVELRFERTEAVLRAEFQRDLRLHAYALLAGNAAIITAVTALGRLI